MIGLRFELCTIVYVTFVALTKHFPGIITPTLSVML